MQSPPRHQRSGRRTCSGSSPDNGFPPRLVVDDACLRCSRLFLPGEITRVVIGGAAAKHRAVALTICAPCVREPGSELDVVIGGTVYVPGRPGRTWPRYVGTTGCDGFLKLARLENGAFRVGLHRGHAEVWTAEQVAMLGQAALRGVYSHDLSLYGSRELFPDGWGVVEVQFVDLRVPAPLCR
jgi:hypothetical protein